MTRGGSIDEGLKDSCPEFHLSDEGLWAESSWQRKRPWVLDGKSPVGVKVRKGIVAQVKGREERDEGRVMTGDGVGS